MDESSDKASHVSSVRSGSGQNCSNRIGHRSRREGTRGECIPHNSLLVGRECRATRDELITATTSFDTTEEAFMVSK